MQVSCIKRKNQYICNAVAFMAKISKMRINIRLLAWLPMIFLGSCGTVAVDVEPPEIEIVESIPQAEESIICGNIDSNVFLLTGGDQLTLDCVFSDNEGLSQYKIDIHNNFDCHGHGGGTAPSIVVPNVDNVTTDWTVLNIEDLTGTSSSVVRVLDVPENVTAGNYHFQLQVIDESGNDNPLNNIYSLKIKNPLDSIPPEITVEEPTSSAFVTVKGESIRFKGTVTDARSLSDGGNGILYLAYTDLSSGNTFTTDQAFAFDETVNKDYSFDFDYTVPLTLVAGDYRFSLGANDGVRNVSSFIFFDVQVTN